jgi:hypothetical protein
MMCSCAYLCSCNNSFIYTFTHTHTVFHMMCAKFHDIIWAILSKKKSHQHMPKYQLLWHYKHCSVSRYCMVSVLINYPHAYSHQWQTLLTCSLYLFWTIDLACKVIRPRTTWKHLVGPTKDIFYQHKPQPREELLQWITKTANHITGNYEIIRKATSSIWDAMNFANRMVEVILNRD